MRSGAILVLTVASLLGFGASSPGQRIFASAHQAISYYRQLGEASPEAGTLERAALSLLLASADPARPNCRLAY